VLLVPVPASGADAARDAETAGDETAPSAAPAAAGATHTGLSDAGTVEGPEAESCATGHVALPPAERLAEEGRWEDIELVYAERLDCGDASYARVLRDHHRSEKDWAKADQVRDALSSAGFEVRDTPQGTQVRRLS
jgi:hypothetical protein